MPLFMKENMQIKVYASKPDATWYFRVSEMDDNSVMLLSYHKRTMWSGVKFFKQVEDAMFFSDYLRKQIDTGV